MKLGIFGDSFADENMRKGKSWVKWLRDDYDYDVVDSYGYGGSALEWSYNNFLKHYEKYDKVIFLMTDVRRQHYFDTESREELLFHVSKERSREQIKQYKNDKKHTVKKDWNLRPNNKTDDKILLAAENISLIYRNTYDWKETAVQDSVSLKVKDSIVINFDLMLGVQQIDYDKLNVNFRRLMLGRVKETDNRPCHMSLKQNEEFARYIHEHFLKKCNIHEILKRPEEHFTPSATLEESGLKIL